MESEHHPLVNMLLTRIKSHPEEFVYTGLGQAKLAIRTPMRWDYAIRIIKEHGTNKDNEAIHRAIKLAAMNAAHEWAMDELMNGPERRSQEKQLTEARMLEAQKALTQRATAQQVMSGITSGALMAPTMRELAKDFDAQVNIHGRSNQK